jgi:hypothetical protein
MQDSAVPYLRINNSTQAQLWPGLVGKLKTQDSSSQSNAWHNILILMKKNFKTSPAEAWPYGLASKLQTQILNSQSNARHSILILTNQNFNSSSAQAWSCGLVSKLQIQSLSMKLPHGRANEPLGVKNASIKERPTAGPYRPLEGSWCRDPQQCGPFGAKFKNSTLNSKKFQHKPSSGKSL